MVDKRKSLRDQFIKRALAQMPEAEGNALLDELSNGIPDHMDRSTLKGILGDTNQVNDIEPIGNDELSMSELNKMADAAFAKEPENVQEIPFRPGQGNADLVDMSVDPNKKQTINMNIRGIAPNTKAQAVDPTPPVVNEATAAVLNDLANQPPEKISADLGDIDGFFTPPEHEAQSADIFKQINNEIDNGNLDGANRLIETARNLSSLTDSFRKDLSPEAMLADRLRARQQRRLGQTETNFLTKSGQFEGEKRSPFDLQQDKFLKEIKSLDLLGRVVGGNKNRAVQERNINLQTERLNKEIQVNMANMKKLKLDIENSKSNAERKINLDLLKELTRIQDKAFNKRLDLVEIIDTSSLPNRNLLIAPLMEKIIESGSTIDDQENKLRDFQRRRKLRKSRK